ncbi:mannosyl-oligosaccharide glucosidase isoform X2 [Oratosquilla oratoria]
MARQRKTQLSEHTSHPRTQISNSPFSLRDDSSSSHRTTRARRSTSKNGSGNWCWTMMYSSVAVAVISSVAWFLYWGYMETRINTPFNAPKVVMKTGVDVPERYWGTFRPGAYFGTRTRHPISLVTGLMWFVPGHFQNNMLALRHWCDQSDDLPKYGWEKHDGFNFGRQTITDKHVVLQTDYVRQLGGRHGGDWSARIKVMPKSSHNVGTPASLLYYVALDLEDNLGSLTPQLFGSSMGTIIGYSESVGSFQLHIVNTSGVIQYNHHLSTKHRGLDMLRETVFQGLRVMQGHTEKEKVIGLAGDLFDHTDHERNPNFIVFQLTGIPPFEFEVVYQSDSYRNRPVMLMGEAFTEELNKYENRFNHNFESKFSMKAKGFSEEEINFAKATLSNMVGGIGYFYGASRVQGAYNADPVPYWKAPLYSGVPSRSFFPRGFLWDEGFHNLLISKWNKEISMDILAHWFDLMNHDGWIPREQILGTEARARVPSEFVVQRDKNANPPTLLLTLHSMMKDFQEELSDENYDYLVRLWPRLKAWYNWFNTTQVGDMPGTYRWRGRDPITQRELNPKTLTSGLDDYPRASNPTPDERHLDLRCWMALASGLMADIGRLIEKDTTRFEETFKYLTNNELLDSLHWSYTANGYMDFGLHTPDVDLRRFAQNQEKIRVLLSDPKLRYIDSFGYVSFFPLFLQIIDPYSSKLGKVLEDLHRTDLLWTPYGLRSLAKNSPMYLKKNTEHDPPYWRGAIWINMNFLAVRALKFYSTTDGPYRTMADELYKELRQNVVKNVQKEYKRTGYVWEHYNDKTGKGEGCRPFTGWTGLVVLMMGEAY